FKPSFAPSSTTSTPASLVSSGSRRRSPSTVVSPLTPALTTVQRRRCASTRACSCDGKLSSIDGDTARLSPSTTTRRIGVGIADGDVGVSREPHAAVTSSSSADRNFQRAMVREGGSAGCYLLDFFNCRRALLICFLG